MNFMKYMDHMILDPGQGRDLGGGAAFHTLAKDMSLIVGATHFTHELRPRIISTFQL